MTRLTPNQKAAFGYLNAEYDDYIVDYHGKVHDQALGNAKAIPKIWGTWFRRGKRTLYLEHQADEYGGNWRWYVRTKQGDPDSSLSESKKKAAALLQLALLITD